MFSCNTENAAIERCETDDVQLSGCTSPSSPPTHHYSYSFFAKYPLFTTVDCMIPYTDSPRPRYDSAADLAVGFVVSWSMSRLWCVCVWLGMSLREGKWG